VSEAFHLKASFRGVLWGMAAIWLLAVALGASWVMRYDATAGTKGAAPQQWRSIGGLEGAEGHPFIVMALHPRCSCSQATLIELNKVLSQVATRPKIEILFYRPADAPEDWLRGALYDEVTRAGYRVVGDPDGKTALTLGLKTSGDMAVYDAEGALRFSGGITVGRGEVGGNGGEDALLLILGGKRAAMVAGTGVAEHPVYGCPLVTTNQTKLK
jgi:hypothetical protein